jgi:carboxymethylenebutenolidase
VLAFREDRNREVAPDPGQRNQRRPADRVEDSAHERRLHAPSRPAQSYDARMLIQEMSVDLPTPTGPMRTYVHRPAGDRRWPGIVFFSEIFQQTGPIKRTAQLLAGHGYVVAVPEVYHELEPPGTVLAYDQAGADQGNRHKTEKPIGAFDDDARAVIAWLKNETTGALGALGICLGGHLAFRAAMNPEIRATACLYATDLHKGGLGKNGDDSLARADEITGELLMIWGRQDPHIPPEGRAKIHERLAARRMTWHEFNGQHAFVRDEGHRYDAELAMICYRLMLDLFARELRG